MLVKKVIWDTDNEEVNLPESIEVPDNIDDNDVADWLSDEYGWCVKEWSC